VELSWICRKASRGSEDCINLAVDICTLFVYINDGRPIILGMLVASKPLIIMMSEGDICIKRQGR
jgi:hypothetical protein